MRILVREEEMDVLIKKVKKFPKTPGVYLFRGARRKVLYVGKATSLRDRVRSYFSGQEEKSRGTRMRHLVEETHDIEIIETDSVLEALILEAELIKKYQPKYNIDGKDDKSFSYFVITKEDFPRVLILHKTDFGKKKYKIPLYTKGRTFGPYTSTYHMRAALKIIRRIFPFHNRSEKSEKGCLSYQIGLCPGPYDGAITRAAYKRNMRNISLFLSGHKSALVKKLEVEMRQAARKEDFEDAQKLKQQIFALTHINDIAFLSREVSSDTYRTEAYDISHINGDHMVASMVVFRGHTPEKNAYRKFKLKAVEGVNDLAAMRETLARRLRHLSDWGVPDAIVVDGGAVHLAMTEKLFNDFDIKNGPGKKIGILAVAKGPTRKKVDVYASKFFPPRKTLTKDKDLLEALREEAHRFAITYHKSLRDKGLINN